MAWIHTNSTVYFVFQLNMTKNTNITFWLEHNTINQYKNSHCKDNLV